MSLFDMLNSPAPNKPSYMKGSELPLFVPLKITKIEPAVTIIGPTTKVEALMGTSLIFFYLNSEDHKKMVESDGVNQLMELVKSNQNPYCFSVKKRSSLGTAFVPFDADIVVQARSMTRMKLSQIPAVVLADVDLNALRESGIVLEP